MGATVVTCEECGHEHECIVRTIPPLTLFEPGLRRIALDHGYRESLIATALPQFVDILKPYVELDDYSGMVAAFLTLCASEQEKVNARDQRRGTAGPTAGED